MISKEIMICNALRDFVPFVQFKKREEHPWRIVTFSKVAGFRPTTVLEKRCFPVNFGKFLRAPFFVEHLRASASVVKTL